MSQEGGTGGSGTSRFRRAYIEEGAVYVETAPGVHWYIPNPTPEGRAYDPRTVLSAVILAGQVNLERWRKL